jgi:hypothetical protein
MKNSTSETEETEESYTFRGRTFKCAAHIIQYLNWCLAMNRSTERYVKVTVKKNKHGEE